MANAQRIMASSVAPSVTTESRPVPDPTVLTTQQIYNAVANLRDVMDVRLCAMDKAVGLLHETANRTPTIGEVHGVHGTKIEGLERRLDHKYIETATDLAHLRDLHAARMDGIENLFKAQFEERDKRFNATLQSQKDAATEAQKASSAAITKAEVATNDTLHQLQTLFQTSIGALNTQVQDLKSRLDRGEAGTAGQREARGDDRATHLDSRALVFSIVAAMAAGGAVLVGFLNFAKLH